jgi:hypothetical protein
MIRKLNVKSFFKFISNNPFGFSVEIIYVDAIKNDVFCPRFLKKY